MIAQFHFKAMQNAFYCQFFFFVLSFGESMGLRLGDMEVGNVLLMCMYGVWVLLQLFDAQLNATTKDVMQCENRPVFSRIFTPGIGLLGSSFVKSSVLFLVITWSKSELSWVQLSNIIATFLLYFVLIRVKFLLKMKDLSVFWMNWNRHSSAIWSQSTGTR